MTHAFDEARLLRLAGDKAFARGRRYCDAGAVTGLDFREGRHTAIVFGTQPYSVSLGWQTGQLDGKCNCPAAEGGSFCKHQVALGLAVLAPSQPTAERATGTAVSTHTKAAKKAKKKAEAKPPANSAMEAPEDDDTLVRRWLSELAQAELITMLLRHASSDRDAWRGLVASARAALAPPEELRSVLKDLIGNPRFMDSNRTMQYAMRLQLIFDIVQTQMQRDVSHGLGLMVYALHRLLKVYSRLDDSYGHVGDVVQQLGQALGEAIVGVPTQTDAFSKELFAVLEIDDWNALPDLTTFAPALGAVGMARLQKMAERKLEALPPPAGRYDELQYERRSAERLLERVLRASGDIDAVISRRTAALKTGNDYLRLAQLCAEHGRDRQATEWLERGIKTDPGETRLHDALAERYHRDGLVEDALALRRQVFERQPTEAHFAALRQLAITCTDWPALRDALYAGLQHSRFEHDSVIDMTVRFMLVDGDIDGAKTLAFAKKVNLHTWAALLEAIESQYPDLAARIVRMLIDSNLERSYNSDYKATFRLLERLKVLAACDSTAAETCAACIADLRQTQGRKRKLMSFLDSLG